MKFLIAVLLIQSGLAFAAPKHGSECRVVTVVEANNPWEEGLGVFGDPEVDSDSQDVSFTWKGKKLQSISVGQMTWIPGTETITIDTEGTTSTYQIDYSKSSSVLLKVYSSQRGLILQRGRIKDKWKTVGTFDCSPIDKVETASIGDANVKALKGQEIKKLPRLVQDNFGKVDLPFELGDGYYDLKVSRYYSVTEDSGDVFGYLLWARLSYTEDKDYVEVLVRFDRNGLRLGDIER